MIFRTITDEGGPSAIVLDDEGIDWLIEGLRELKASEPGIALTCPSFVEDGEGGFTSATEFFLKRHDPDNPGWRPSDVPSPPEQDTE